MNHIDQANKCEIEERATKCLQMLMKGYKRFQIVEELTKEFDCSAHTIDNALKKAYEIREKEAEKMRSEAFNDAITALTELRKDMTLERDFKGAVNAQKELNKICGLEKTSIDFGEDKEITIKVKRV